MTVFQPNDPYVRDQWQLRGLPGTDLMAVLDEYRGAGVRIGIVDTGVNYATTDLLGRFDLGSDYDAFDADDDASQPTGDQHGTTVAMTLGAAANNGVRGIGAAPDATLVAFRMANLNSRTPGQELAVLERQDQVDVSNNSWSWTGHRFRDNFLTETYAPHAAAIADAATHGRGGLGTIWVRSAGNGGATEDVNAHNFQNNRFTIAVGAMDGNGHVLDLSSPGAALTLVAPATATSFAAPLVSATAALMLQANPDLGYRDVQTILAATATRIEAGNAGWAQNGAAGWNGGGLMVLRQAGFGALDAHAAVRLAETWERQGTEASVVTATASAGRLAVPDIGTVESRVSIRSALVVERAEVTLDLDHDRIAHLVVTLISPSGTESVLLSTLGGALYPRSGILTASLTSTHFLWEDAYGGWRLRITDTAAAEFPLAAPALNDWSLTLYGAARSVDTLHLFTQDYASVLAEDPSRGVLRDTEGHDVLNASGIKAASVINLRPGASSTLAGAALRIAAGTVIEDAEGGDGADRISGNSVANRLRGWQGDDRLDGGAGDDRLVGGIGDDRIEGGVGFDQAVFMGAVGAYRIEALAVGMARITGPDGTDVVSGIEALVFDDATTALPTSANRAPTGLSLDGRAVIENLPAFTVIGRLGASDADGDALVYSVLDPSGRLSVIDDRLVTAMPIDADTMPLLPVIIRATDQSGAFTDTEVTITVRDVADQPGLPPGLAATPPSPSPTPSLPAGLTVTTEDWGTLIEGSGVWGVARTLSSVAGAWSTAIGRALVVFNVVDVSLDLSNAPPGFAVEVTGLKRGSVRGSDQADAISLHFHSDWSSSGNLARIRGEGGNDTITLSSVGRSSRDERLLADNTIPANGATWNPRYDGRYSSAEAEGGAGDDVITAEGLVTLVARGGMGQDRITGGSNADVLDGGAGADLLAGGLGRDLFILRAGEADGDSITDFTRTGSFRDTLHLLGFGPGAQVSETAPGAYTIHAGGLVTGTFLAASGLVSGTDMIFA